MSRTTNASTLRCTRCGAEFACDPQGECWCKDESVRLPMPKAAESCLCPKCLRALAAEGRQS
jgi:hypothetical protein